LAQPLSQTAKTFFMRNIRLIIIVFLTGMVAFSSCRKQSAATGLPGDVTYFMFGSVGGFCPSVCAQYYKVVGGGLYKSYVDSADVIRYPDTALSAGKYALAQPLMTGFPAWFSSHPNRDVKCSTCADMGFIHLEYERAGQLYQWNVDYPYDGIPVEIKAYIEQVSSVMTQLQ
jgi:hypothetical protein